ncbi:tripartite tricarboxylate transporter substrate binding protein [Hydrogenophaga sp.]|uniref:Bug family tripartite tricarboxylate transporter substrate binding protein n=1 Tax=Hydrogenophaga sp. TaxID=1904254 RepID=UPI0027180CF9|nr:tripartite tricarboxylate transporter substrate binding protein [Hydrogenophaga sp.]MDO9436549.1 tripartite tricarboxylate transporter substrate binding protein [Hydrogenophaga sp.]
MTIHRRNLIGFGAASIATSLLPHQASAQTAFPTGPIRILLPTPAGGGNDAICRFMGERMTEQWKQPVVVDNRSGAAGIIATQALVRSPADGHTIMYTNSNVLSSLVVHSAPGYRLSDLAPVSWVCDIPIAIGVTRTLGVNSLKELVALARARPGKLSYASPGAGGSPNFVGELLKGETGTAIVHIPYRGDAPAVQAVVAGEVEIVIGTVGLMARYPDKIKILAAAGEKRFPSAPDVPTLREEGYPAVDMPGWGGFFAPAGTPAPIVQRLAGEIERLLKLPELSRRMIDFGFLPLGYGPEKFAPMMTDHLERFRKVVAQGRIQVTQ